MFIRYFCTTLIFPYNFLLSVGTTCEHLGFCVALKVPMAVVISKIDLCSKEKVEQVVKKLETLLTNPGCNRVPRRIATDNDVYATAHNFKESKYVTTTRSR